MFMGSVEEGNPISILKRKLLAKCLILLAIAFTMLAKGPRLFAQALQAPGNQNTADAQDQGAGEQVPQTKRILGIMPNFRAVSSTSKLPPQTVKEKFVTATQDSFDYSAVFVPAMLAAYSLGINDTPEFGHGASGYGQYFWHSALDQTSENYMVEFVVPAIAHQDTRYYTLGRGGFLKRTVYSLSRTLITRSDSAKREFNISEVLGAGISSALSSTYYPASQRNFSTVGEEWGTDIGIDALSFTLKEFWPDINRALFHGTPAQSATQH